MGMGYCGSFALTIDENAVIKVIGKSLLNKFNKAINESPLGEEVLMTDYFDPEDLSEHDLNEGDEAKVLNAVNALREVTRAFKKATKMTIMRSYHSADDDGDRYDDVNGGFWELDFSEVFSMRKRAKDLESITKAKISISHYVQFG